MQIIRKMLSPSIKYTYQVISKCLATHPNFYVLMKLGNMMRVPKLNPNFSIKYDLKLVSRTRRKNVWSKIDQGLHFA